MVRPVVILFLMRKLGVTTTAKVALRLRGRRRRIVRRVHNEWFSYSDSDSLYSSSYLYKYIIIDINVAKVHVLGQ